MAMLTAYSSFMSKEDILLLFKKQHVATYAEGQTERVLVAERAGMLVGVADLMLLNDNWRLVEPLHVRPGHQRMGIGRMLWAKCEQIAVDRLAPGIRVVSLRANSNANAFYKAMGCVEVGEETLTIGATQYPMIRFEKRFS
jgi:ribosomal protein S18 acetylase RimI-like enzyme